MTRALGGDEIAVNTDSNVHNQQRIFAQKSSGPNPPGQNNLAGHIEEMAKTRTFRWRSTDLRMCEISSEYILIKKMKEMKTQHC